MFLSFLSFDTSTSGPCLSNTLCLSTWPAVGFPAPEAAVSVKGYGGSGPLPPFDTATEVRSFAAWNGSMVGLFNRNDAGAAIFNLVDPFGAPPQSVLDAGPVTVYANSEPRGVVWNPAVGLWQMLFTTVGSLVFADSDGGVTSIVTGAPVMDATLAVVDADAGIGSVVIASIVQWAMEQSLSLRFIRREMSEYHSNVTVVSLVNGYALKNPSIVFSPAQSRFGVVWSDNRTTGVQREDIFFSGLACEP
ncbi:MAG: hypothetical protein HYY84_13845 [Deltaproteobacteria bacterium]|nr:hypothetical protein [Deltaproteobacteria bacterium]